MSNFDTLNDTSADWMKSLVNADYVEFAKSVKQEINNRYINSPYVRNVERRATYYNNLAQYFANAPLDMPNVSSGTDDEV